MSELRLDGSLRWSVHSNKSKYIYSCVRNVSSQIIRTLFDTNLGVVRGEGSSMDGGGTVKRDLGTETTGWDSYLSSSTLMVV